MTRRERLLYRQAVDLFIEMLENITKRKRINYKCNDADVLAFEAFCKEFDTNVIGIEFLRTFLEYQFQSWFNKGMDRDYSRQVRFNWMFGEKAIRRYRVFDPETNRRLVQIHIKKLGIYQPKVVRRTDIPELINRIRPIEEKFKGEFLNTKRGFAWCVANTTLFNHKSSFCARCKYKTDCKKVLKESLPKVYVKRGYGKE